jgi:hypothetical protein
MAREAEAARGDIQIWPYKKVHSFTDKWNQRIWRKCTVWNRTMEKAA